LSLGAADVAFAAGIAEGVGDGAGDVAIGDLPSEVKARLSSVVMASRMTGTGCCGRAAEGRMSSVRAAVAGAR
jgi:hypothetical protein